jgi:hypothetical protein
MANQTDLFSEKQLINNFQDRTNCETWYSEVGVNYEVKNKKLSIYEALVLAFIIAECWINKLKRLKPKAKFCFIFSCDNEYVTIRYHKMRKGEKWLCDNIDEYEQPVGYIIE